MYSPYLSFDTSLPDEEREEFISKINEFFEPAIILHSKEHPFRWDTVYNFVSRYKSEIPHSCKLEFFCTYLINLLYQLPCYDKSVVTRILYFYTDWLRGMEYRHGEAVTGVNYAKECTRVTLNDVLTKEKPKYVYDDKDYSPLQDSVVTAILTGDLKLMKILVRYGVTSYMSWHNFTIIEARSILYNYFLLEPFCKYLRPDLLFVMYQSLVVSRILEPLNSLFLEPGIKRIHVILMFLNAVARGRHANEDTNYSECLKLFFQTVAIPIFSVREIKRFVHHAFDGFYTKDITEEICDALRIMFPEVTENYQPRSLRHLSRCQVRNIFVKEPRVLKVEIDELVIPDLLKQYILIEAK